MAATIIDELAIRLNFDTTEFNQRIAEFLQNFQQSANQTQEHTRNLQNSVDSLSGALGTAASVAGKLIGALVALGAVKSFGEAVVNTGKQLADLSWQSGESAETISKLGYAAKLSGENAEAAQKQIVDFTTSLERAKMGIEADVNRMSQFGTLFGFDPFQAKNMEEVIKKVREFLKLNTQLTEQQKIQRINQAGLSEFASLILAPDKDFERYMSLANKGAEGADELAASSKELTLALAELNTALNILGTNLMQNLIVPVTKAVETVNELLRVFMGLREQSPLRDTAIELTKPESMTKEQYEVAESIANPNAGPIDTYIPSMPEGKVKQKIQENEKNQEKNQEKQKPQEEKSAWDAFKWIFSGDKDEVITKPNTQETKAKNNENIQTITKTITHDKPLAEKVIDTVMQPGKAEASVNTKEATTRNKPVIEKIIDSVAPPDKVEAPVNTKRLQPIAQKQLKPLEGDSVLSTPLFNQLRQMEGEHRPGLAQGYDSVYTGSLRGRKRSWKPSDPGYKPVSQMTIDEVLSHQPKHFGAAGQWQITKDTLKGLKRDMNLTGQERFSPEMQDKMALRLLQQKPGFRKFESAKTEAEARRYLTRAQNDVASLWASAPKAGGGSQYEGVQGNKALTTSENMQNKLMGHWRQRQQARQQAQQMQKPVNTTQTKQQARQQTQRMQQTQQTQKPVSIARNAGSLNTNTAKTKQQQPLNINITQKPQKQQLWQQPPSNTNIAQAKWQQPLNINNLQQAKVEAPKAAALNTNLGNTKRQMQATQIEKVVNNSTVNNHSVHISKMEIMTQATNAESLARNMVPAIEAQYNFGIN